MIRTAIITVTASFVLFAAWTVNLEPISKLLSNLDPL